MFARLAQMLLLELNYLWFGLLCKDDMMLLQKRKKAGYTLVEVAVVVAIMGILSIMGVSGIQAAVANARVKDGAINAAAFMERVAHLSKQQSDYLCLMIDNTNPSRLLAQKSKGSDCSKTNKYGTETVAELVIEAPAKFVANSSGTCNYRFNLPDLPTSEAAVFKPRIGLSSVPKGVVCVQYGDEKRFGVAVKDSLINTVKSYWTVGSHAAADTDLWYEL